MTPTDSWSRWGRVILSGDLEAETDHRVQRFDNVGITVADLDTVTAFFVALGLDAEDKMVVEGAFLDTVIGNSWL